MNPRRCPTCGREPTRAFCKAYCSPDPFAQLPWKFALGSLLITAIVPIFVIVAWPTTSIALLAQALPRIRKRLTDSFARLGATIAITLLVGMGSTALSVAAALAGLSVWKTLSAG